MKDRELTEKLKKSDRTVFEEIFNKYYKIIFVYVMKMCRDFDIAEDVTQNAFLSLWTKREKINIHTSIKKYLFSIARNFYIDHYRKLEREKNSFSLYQYQQKEATRMEMYEAEDTSEDIRLMKALIEELPPKCKEILLLSKEKGLKYKEIADQLNISLKTVESQMYIAMKKLREGFKEARNKED